MGPRLRLARVLALALICAFAASGCTSDMPAADAGTDPRRDAGNDGGAVDGGGTDAGAIDGGAIDGGAIDGAIDAADLDAGASDGGIDARACDAAAGAVELCNGIDDDCDGTIDPGCICPIAAPVPVLDGDEWSLAAASDGTVLLASQDFGTLALTVQRYGADFAPIGTRTTLVADATRPPNDLGLFALGPDFGAVWRQWPSSTLPSDDAWFAAISASTGALTTPPVDLTPSAGVLGLSAAPFGAGFVLARREQGPLDSSLAVRIVDATGHVTAGPHRVTELLSVSYTGVGVVGTTIGVAYQADDGTGAIVRFQRFDSAAQPLGPSIALDTMIGASHPMVAAQASGWGVVWDAGTEVRFAAIDPSGAIAVPARTIAPGGGFQGLAIAADQLGHWGVIHRAAGGVRFHYLDATGADRGPPITAGPSYVTVGQPALVFDGTRFVASVHDTAPALWVPCPAM